MISFQKRITIKVCSYNDWYFFILCQLCQIRLCLWKFFYLFLFSCFWLCSFSALMLCKSGFYFLFRNNISFKMVSAKSKAVTPEMVAGWNETTLPTLISNYDLENIYNADKFGLFYQCLPDKSYQLKTGKCLGVTYSKIRITSLPVANAVGNKLSMFVIGQAKNPRCLRTLRNFPVDMEQKERAEWIVFYLKNDWEM